MNTPQVQAQASSLILAQVCFLVNIYCSMLFLEKVISVRVLLCGSAEGKTSCYSKDSQVTTAIGCQIEA
jgi:hypothetical protein